MDRPPTPVLGSREGEDRGVTARRRWLWPSTWLIFAVVVTITVAEYMTIFMSAALPLWVWCTAGGVLALTLAVVAVFADVTSARRTRGGRRRLDVLAQVVAMAVVGVWAWSLWGLLVEGCFDQECASVPVWRPLFTLIPIVPLGVLTLIGYFVRRGVRGLDG